MRNLDNLLKDTLVHLYIDLPEVAYALNNISYDVVNRKFKQKLFELISESEFEEMDNLLHSEAYYKYKDAIDRASMSVTTDLAELIEFAGIQSNEGGKIN